jgi:hypothetical protein
MGRGRSEGRANTNRAFVPITAVTASPMGSTAHPIAARVNAGTWKPETVTIPFTPTTTASVGTNLNFTAGEGPLARGASDKVGVAQMTRAFGADHVNELGATVGGF